MAVNALPTFFWYSMTLFDRDSARASHLTSIVSCFGHRIAYTPDTPDRGAVATPKAIGARVPLRRGAAAYGSRDWSDLFLKLGDLCVAEERGQRRPLTASSPMLTNQMGLKSGWEGFLVTGGETRATISGTAPLLRGN